MELSEAVGRAHTMEKASSHSTDIVSDANFYLVIVQRDDATAKEMLHWLGIRYDRFLDARTLLRALASKIKQQDYPPESLMA